MTSRVVWTSKRAAARTAPSSAPNASSAVASTTDAPWSSASAACEGPASTATARAVTRSEANAAGSVPSGGTRPFETTSTPARSGIRVAVGGQRGRQVARGDGEADEVVGGQLERGGSATRTCSGSATPGR